MRILRVVSRWLARFHADREFTVVNNVWLVNGRPATLEERVELAALLDQVAVDLGQAGHDIAKTTRDMAASFRAAEKGP